MTLISVCQPWHPYPFYSNNLNIQLHKLTETKLQTGGQYECAINVKVDGDVFTYTGRSHETQPGVVKVLHPMNPSLNYFEYEIIAGSKTPEIGIGLGDDEYPLHRMPGWNHNGIGYHSDNGQLYYQKGHGVKYGPTCKAGDRMGCGVDFNNRTSGCVNIFFTKNGQLIGDFIKFNKPESGLYPIIGMCQKGERIRYFGQCYYPLQDNKKITKGNSLKYP